MNILFLGNTCPIETANKILFQTNKNPGYPIIKFTQLLLTAFALQKHSISVLSNTPCHPNRLFCPSIKESKQGINYNYVPVIRIPIIGQITYYIYSFCRTLLWGILTRGKKIVFCDVLASYSCNKGAILAAKLCGIQSCGLITDMIGFSAVRPNSSVPHLNKLFFAIRKYMQKKYLTEFDSFVFLTKYMNEDYNPLKKPYIIMEGCVDANHHINKFKKCSYPTTPRIIMYAGAIEAEYGFDTLIKAFTSLTDPHIALHVYGQGKFVPHLLEYAQSDPRIKYLGIVTNDQILEAEKEATLLINPRYSHHDFVRYSFPSKTTEYMLSGTPLLTTKLCGIPEEYFQHLYTFDEENVLGFTLKLQEILSKPIEELTQKGLEAQNFVLSKKNNRIQANRIVDLFLQTIEIKDKQ